MSKPEHMPTNDSAKKRRGIYLLPNLFTTGGLFAGFYAIVASMRLDFEIAAIAVFIAMVMDGLDGRVARLTNTQSAFGAEYDSLADIVSFGIAPSLVVYNWGLVSMGKVGWLIAFFYAAATALRLARFNSQTDDGDLSFFKGLPCPAAAGWVAGLIWAGVDSGIPGDKLYILVAVVTIMAAIFMVSSIRYHSFKEVDLKGRVPFIAVLAVISLIVFITLDPPKVLLMGFTIYALSGPIVLLRKLIRRKRNQGR